MPSSTSSSSFRPGLAVGTAAAVVALWTLAVQAGFVPRAQETNVTRAEGWLHEGGREARVVIVGSSQVARFPTDALPPGWFDLAIDGGK